MNSISGPGDVPPSSRGGMNNNEVPSSSNPANLEEGVSQDLSQGKLLPTNHPFVRWVQQQFHNVNEEQSRAIATSIMNTMINMIRSQISHMTQVSHQRRKEELRILLDE